MAVLWGVGGSQRRGLAQNAAILCFPHNCNMCLARECLEYRQAVLVLLEHLQMLHNILTRHSQYCRDRGGEDETRLITWQLVEQRMTILKLLMDVVEHELVYELREFDGVLYRVRQRTLTRAALAMARAAV